MTDNEIFAFESYIAGAILNFGEAAVDTIYAQLTADDFTSDRVRWIFNAAVELRQERCEISPVSISEKIRSSGHKMGDSFLRECMNVAPRLENTAEYAKEVHDRAETIRFCDTVQKAADEMRQGTLSLADGRAEMELAMSKICISDSDIISAEDALNSAIQEMEDRANGKVKSISTGFSSIDGLLNGGLENGGLYIIGARPASGKTTFALNIANSIAMQNRRVLFVSLEMTVEQLSRIRLQMVGKIQAADMYHIHTKTVNEKIEIASKFVRQYPVDFNRRPYATVGYIGRMCQGRKVDVVIIDYLQLISPTSGKTMYEKVTGISRSLKGLALQQNIPVVCLSQLNRESSGTDPKMSDLRDSGAIEQDADAVMLLNLYDRGDPSTNEPASLRLRMAKNRYGAIGDVEMNFYLKTRYIEDRYRKN